MSPKAQCSVIFITFCGFFFIFCGDGSQGLSFQFNTCVFLSVSHVCSAELDNRVTAEISAGNGCFLCRRTHNSHLMSCAHSKTTHQQTIWLWTHYFHCSIVGYGMLLWPPMIVSSNNSVTDCERPTRGTLTVCRKSRSIKKYSRHTLKA